MGEKVLVLLPTDQNKLLMQWKGPFEVEIKGTKWGNNYQVEVNKKVVRISAPCKLNFSHVLPWVYFPHAAALTCF